MQKIYLARPGAQKEGPYTLEQINHDLATKKISDTDFWAWHEGLPAWTPLYSVPGVSAKAWVVAVPEVRPQRAAARGEPESEPFPPKPEPEPNRAHVVAAKSKTEAPKPMRNGTPAVKPETVIPTARVVPKPLVSPESPLAKADHRPARVTTPPPEALEDEIVFRPVAKTRPEPQAVEFASARAVKQEPERPKVEAAPAATEEAEASTINVEIKPSEILATPSLSSGKPFAALEQIFVFTTGEGPTVLKSDVTASTLAEAVGQKVDDIWAAVPVDVVGGTTTGVVEAIRSGSIPGSAWRALFRIKRAVAQQIQDGWYHLCVRTFRLESKDLVAVFLLYNKQKL